MTAMLKSSFVYIIAKKADDCFTSPIKVGISDTPEKRLTAIRTACPFPVGIYKVCEFPSRSDALMAERIFHETQGEHHLIGEWFNMDPSRGHALVALNTFFVVRTLGYTGEETINAVCRSSGFSREEISLIEQKFGGAINA